MRLALTIILLIFTTANFAGNNDISFNPDKKDKKLKDLNRRAKYPFGVNLYGFGPGGLASLSMDYFITPKIGLEAGAGFRNSEGEIGYFFGGRYHILGNSFLNLTPYAGVYTAFHHNGHNLQNHSIYVPFGIHRIKKNHITWSVEVAYEANTFKSDNLAFGFRLGYRF